MPAPCSVCKAITSMCCSDCMISDNKQIWVCPTTACRDWHETTTCEILEDLSCWPRGPARRKECELCGWKGRQFQMASQRCPKCGSDVEDERRPGVV